MTHFRLRPHGTSKHITVRVFDTKDKMYAYHRGFASRTGKDLGKLNYIGLFMGYEREKQVGEGRKRMDDIGTVLLVRGYMWPWVVNHELGHAALHFERIAYGNKRACMGLGIGKVEERMLHTLSSLLEGFYDKMDISWAGKDSL